MRIYKIQACFLMRQTTCFIAEMSVEDGEKERGHHSFPPLWPLLAAPPYSATICFHGNRRPRFPILTLLVHVHPAGQPPQGVGAPALSYISD